MKKAVIGVLSLLLLTGCWDQLPLSENHLTDLLYLDLDEESGDVVLGDVVTVLSNATQGGGEINSEITMITKPSLVEAVTQEDRVDQGPMLLSNIRMYVMSERFASNGTIRQLSYLLHAPYASVNAPTVVLDGPVSELLKVKRGKKPYTQILHEFISALGNIQIAPVVPLMHFIVSQESPLEDMALPLVKPSSSGMELSGVLLFHEGTSTRVKLDKDQTQMLMLMSEKINGRQKFAGKMGKDDNYMFSVKKGSSKIVVHPESGGLPKVIVEVRLKIYAFELGKEAIIREAAHVNQMEKVLRDHLQELAAETIKTMQKANSDALGIGKELKAYHPGIWKSMDWRRDYPSLSIEPKFTVQVLNTEVLKNQ